MSDSVVARTPPSGLLVPGRVTPQADLETYWVRPGGGTGVRLLAGDQLTVVDRFGRQPAEVTVGAHTGPAHGAALAVVRGARAPPPHGRAAAGAAAEPLLADL